MPRGKPPANDVTHETPFRLWPGVIAAGLLWLVRFGIPLFMPSFTLFGVIVGVVGGVVLVVWWGVSSRAPWPERLGAIVLMVVALGVTSRLLHESIATAGMGMMFFRYAIPILSLAFVVCTMASCHLSDGPRRAAMVASTPSARLAS